MSRQSIVQFAAATALLLTALQASGQDESSRLHSQPVIARIGVYGALASLQHTTKANVFCCDDGCGVFGNGTGRGVSLGILGEIPIIPMLEGVGSIGFAQRGGDFGVARTGELPILDPVSGEYVTLQRKHSYTAELPEVIAELGVKFIPFATFPIYLRAMFSGSYPLEGSSSYEQTEEILAPTGVTYPETKTTFKQVGGGEIKDISSSYGASGALGYPLSVSNVITISPEVRYYFPLTETKKDFRWKIAAAEAGVVLRWNFYKPLPPPPPPPKEPEKPVVVKEPEPEPPQPYLGLASSESIRVVETTVTETFPILPYIFFDSAVSEVPSRYRTNTSLESFKETDLEHTSLGTYYNLLSVIASRMQKYPDAELVVTGTTDGKEVPKSGSIILARSRAEAVRTVMSEKWNIDPARIKTATRTLPTFPSSLKETAGLEENRRVELSSNDERLLAPIVHEKFKEYEIAPDRMPFAASVRTFAPAKNWRLNVASSNESIYTTSGTGEPPSTIVWRLDNKAAESIAAKVQGKENITGTLSVRDEKDITGSSSIQLPVEKTIYPFELSRLSLIVFDFDKSDISPVNQKMMQSFVAKSIREGSTVTITGTTDAMGELDHNKELSTARAFAVHQLIRKQNPLAEVTKVTGLGPNDSPEMNNTPEGRYYCRTVTVQVQTPLVK